MVQLDILEGEIRVVLVRLAVLLKINVPVLIGVVIGIILNLIQ